MLYFGQYNSKTIIICEKCKAINFLEKFIWTCPLCGVRFKDREDKSNIINNEMSNKRNERYKSPINDINEKNINQNKEEKRKGISNGRKNKENLMILLRGNNELSVEKEKILIGNESKNKINRSIIENNSKTFNIKNFKFDDNKENNNIINNLKIIQLNSTDIDITSKYNQNKRKGLKKSSSESKSLKNYTKRSSYLDKKISNIEPIKEENDIKNNSPQKKTQNINNLKLREFTIQNDASQKSKRIYFNDKENKRDNCFSPRIKNIIYNKYLNYMNNYTNRNNQENKINNKKIVTNYSRRKKEENNKDEIKDENKKNANNIIVFKNKAFNTLDRKIENNKHNYNSQNIPKTNKDGFNDNKNDNNNEIKELKKESKESRINNRYPYHETNYNNSLLSNNNIHKIIINQNSINTSKFILNKSQRKVNNLENEPNQEETHRKWYKSKLLSKENKINTNIELENINEENKENQKNINTIKSRKERNKNNEDNTQENEFNENIRTFRLRSRLKNRINEREGKNEENKNDNLNRENYLYSCTNENRITSFRERFKTLNRKKEEKEEVNKEINEKKQVKSRKEILKEKEKYDNMNLEAEKNYLDKINKTNLINLEKKENKRYTQNQLLDTYQKTVKTKENTISNYTKDSYTSKDNFIIQVNTFSNEFNNNIKKKNSYFNKENNNDDINKINNRNEYHTEIKPLYHAKKTRKDYINERNKKNDEILISDKTKETKDFFQNKKDNLVKTSYQSNKRTNIYLNNIDINIDKEEDIPIFDKELRKDKIKYNQLQYQLKTILVKSCLPKFNIDYYIIKNQIGTGSFGIIFQVYNIKTRCKYALKKIFAPDISSLQKFVKGFELVHQNPHNHILDLIGICIQCVDITNYILYILMDLAEQDWDKEINYRASLKKYYTEEELVNILKQLSSALYFLQKEKKIAHRDIKPENILIFKNEVYKIGDFGEAKENKIPKQFSTLRGTELYMSPLLYNGLHENKEDIKHNQFKSDMFSLGYCFVYAASLNLNIIFKIRDANNMISLKKILMKEFDRRYSEKFLDLILKMIAYNEEKRIDFIELEKILKEKF